MLKLSYYAFARDIELDISHDIQFDQMSSIIFVTYSIMYRLSLNLIKLSKTDVYNLSSFPAIIV